ncbi:2-amino-4-hydroxy-6-hydroxymethyldihydropteridine diphosphokinase [Brachymonas chironomi]|uniref:2-amino-4-hydroxy-6- hydroxymethyldihydropteridine diphosphokinase n=1 Tax=Brachymonas chironomi TaxID=491919 RepID=UPI000368776A|nr:2-amino-4-hydroxy-6-hydroxymethyldihydropteridine diphosphokinase [Brachymonas chironomi]
MTSAIVAPSLAWVALGGNLGDARQSVQQALQALDALPQTRLEAASSLYRTAPVDASGPDFINAVARLRTSLAPLALLQALQGLEQQAGRERPYRNAPRTLDLDVLLYSGVRQQTPELELPHPRMLQRAFVLVPLAEIDAELVPPEMLQAVADQAIERLA